MRKGLCLRPVIAAGFGLKHGCRWEEVDHVPLMFVLLVMLFNIIVCWKFNVEAIKDVKHHIWTPTDPSLLLPSVQRQVELVRTQCVFRTIMQMTNPCFWLLEVIFCKMNDTDAVTHDSPNLLLPPQPSSSVPQSRFSRHQPPGTRGRADTQLSSFVFRVAGWDCVSGEFCWEHTVRGHLCSFTVHVCVVSLTPTLREFLSFWEFCSAAWCDAHWLGVTLRTSGSARAHTLTHSNYHFKRRSFQCVALLWLCFLTLCVLLPFRSMWRWTTSEQQPVRGKALLLSQNALVPQSQSAACK